MFWPSCLALSSLVIVYGLAKLFCTKSMYLVMLLNVLGCRLT